MSHDLLFFLLVALVLLQHWLNRRTIQRFKELVGEFAAAVGKTL